MNQGVIPYPQRKESLVQFARNVFLPVTKQYCVTCLFAPGGGKRTFITFLLKEKTILQALFGSSYRKTLFLYVNPDEALEETNEAYLRLMVDTLVLSLSEHSISYPTPAIQNPLQLLKYFVSLLVHDSWRVVFLLSDFEYTLTLSPSIYRNLETILGLEKEYVAFVFLSGCNLITPELLLKFHNLKYSITRFVTYRPLLTHEERLYLMGKVTENLGASPLNASQIRLLERLCGGHPQLLKFALTALIQSGNEYLKNDQSAEKFILDYPQLHTICADIWHALTKREQQCVFYVYRSRKITSPEDSDYLRQTGLLWQKGNEYFLFGTLFTQYIQSVIPAQKLVYTADTDELYYGAKNCGHVFTPQEFRLLTHLIGKHAAVVSRDEVGQVLWGKEYFEKYSDWMIDKIISTIRKKLDGIGFSSHKLITLKKRGFYLVE